MDINIFATGLPTTLDNLRVLNPALAANVAGRGMIDFFRVVRNDIRQAAPRRTGRLARSVTAARTRGRVDTLRGPRSIPGAGARLYVGGRRGRQDAFYALWVERGTSRFKARPFAVPVVQSAVRSKFQLITQGAQKEMARLKGLMEAPADSPPRGLRAALRLADIV